MATNFCLHYLSSISTRQPPKDGPGADYLWFISFPDATEKELRDKGISNGTDWVRAQVAKGSAVAFKEVLARIEGVVEPVKSIVQETRVDEGEPISPIFLRKVKIEAFPEGRVTCLGDAAHAMSLSESRIQYPLTSSQIMCSPRRCW